MFLFAKSTVVIAWLALIFVTSQASFPPPDPNFEPGWFDYIFDKDVHVLLYGILAVLLLWTLQETRWRRPARYGAVVLAALAYGVLDEWHQSFVPGRSVSGWDLLFDVVGAGLGIVCWRAWHEWPQWYRGVAARLIHRRGTAS